MNKKFNKRETKIIKLMIFIVVVALMVESYDRYNKAKEAVQFQISTEVLAQETLLNKLTEQPEAYIKKSEDLSSVMLDAEERILRMDNQSNAQFQFQEDITKAADKTEISLNSLNKRRSKELFKGSDMVQLKTYFGFNCPLINLLEFMDQVGHKEYFMVFDTLNINVNTTRRRAPKKGLKEEPDPGITVRGSCVLATLYKKGANEVTEPEDTTAEDDILENGMDDMSQEESKSSVGDKKGKSATRLISNPKVTFQTETGAQTTLKKSGSKPSETQPVSKLIGTKPESKTLVKEPRPMTHTNQKKGGKK